MKKESNTEKRPEEEYHEASHNERDAKRFLCNFITE